MLMQRSVTERWKLICQWSCRFKVTSPRCWSTHCPLRGERTSQCLVGYETGFESVWLGVNTGFAVRVHTILYWSYTRWIAQSKAVGLSLSGLGLGRGKERVALQAQIQAQKLFTWVWEGEFDFSEGELQDSWKSYIKYVIWDRWSNVWNNLKKKL